MMEVIWEGHSSDGQKVRLMRHSVLETLAFAVQDAGRWTVLPLDREDAEQQIGQLTHHIAAYLFDQHFDPKDYIPEEEE